MAQIAAALDGILYNLISAGSPTALNDFGAVLHHHEQNWGNQPIGGAVNSQNSLVQGAAKLIAQTLSMGRSNSWVEMRNYRNQFFNRAPEAITHFIGHNSEDHYMDRIGLVGRPYTPGSGLGLTFTITQGVTGQAAKWNYNFNGAAPVDPVLYNDGIYFFLYATPAERHIFWCNTDGTGNEANAIAAVQVNDPAPGGVVDIYHEILLATGNGPADITLAIKTAAGPFVPGTWASTADNIGTFDFTNAYVGFVPGANAGTFDQLGFAVPIGTLQNPLDQVEESTKIEWLGTPEGNRRATEELIGGNWFGIYYNSTDGHTIWFNVDGGSTPPPALPGTSLVEVAISSTNRVAEACELAKVAIEGIGDYIVTANGANSFTITPTVPVGDVKDAVDGTDGLLTYDTEVKGYDASVLASGLITDADYVAAHNTLKIPYDEAAGIYPVYLDTTGVDGWLNFGNYEGRVSVLSWNRPGVIFDATQGPTRCKPGEC